MQQPLTENPPFLQLSIKATVFRHHLTDFFFSKVSLVFFSMDSSVLGNEEDGPDVRLTLKHLGDCWNEIYSP